MYAFSKHFLLCSMNGGEVFMKYLCACRFDFLMHFTNVYIKITH